MGKVIIRRKYLRSISVIAMVILLGFSCIAFSACPYSPAEPDEWYIEYIEENGVRYNARDEDYYNGTLISSDYMVFSFTKDGAVTITDIDGSVQTGIFSGKNELANMQVTVKLDDGTRLTGSCGQYYFDATWYTLKLSNDNITYQLSVNNDYPKEKQRGKILKDVYPEIAQLTATDIQEINYCIENDGEIKLVGEKNKKAFLSCFSTSNFISPINFVSPKYYNSATLTVKTSTDDYIIPLYAHKTENVVYIAYDSAYYRLKGGLAEWLFGFSLNHST